jgi:hypothetical protein
MLAEQPEIARLTDRRTRCWFGPGISRVLRGWLVFESGDLEIDLTHLKTDDLDAEVELSKREVFELLGEEPLVPLRLLGEPVVGVAVPRISSISSTAPAGSSAAERTWLAYRYDEFPDNHTSVDNRMDESLPFFAQALSADAWTDK